MLMDTVPNWEHKLKKQGTFLYAYFNYWRYKLQALKNNTKIKPQFSFEPCLRIDQFICGQFPCKNVVKIALVF